DNNNDQSVVLAFNDKNADGSVTVQRVYSNYWGRTSYPAYIGNERDVVPTRSGLNGVTRIVREIIFPDTTIAISANAFKGNTDIEVIDLSQSKITYIGASAFEGCTNLREIRLPDTLKTIGANAFKGCSNLKSELDKTMYNDGLLNLKNVTSIGANAFEMCNSPQFVTIDFSDEITTLGKQAFMNCSALEAIEIPASVTDLGESVFFGCNHMSNAIVRTNILSVGLFEQCGTLGTVTLNSNITVIPERAFCKTLCTSFKMPENLVEIKAQAFEETSMPSLVLPDSTIKVGASAFRNSTAMASINLNKVEEIGEYAFAGCSHSKLTSIVVPETVTALGDHVFANCTSLETVTIKTATLATYMFAGCTNLTTPIYEKISEITAIPKGMYRDCEKFKDIQLFASDQNVTTIGEYAFFNTGYTTLTLGDNITTVGKDAFAECKKLLSVDINSVEIGVEMFYNCPIMTTVTVGSAPEVIGESAFAKLPKLKNIHLNDTTLLGDKMFADCITLETVTIPASVGDNVGKEVFARDVLLKSIIIENTKIGEDMFNGCQALVSIEITHITKLTDYAFRGSSLRSISLPATIESVGVEVFAESHLETINFENGYHIIGDKMFFNCLNLTEVNIPTSVNEVGISAFEGCSNLTKVTLNSSPVIGERMFANCKKLPEILIGRRVTTVGDEAFAGCDALTKVTLGNTILSNGMFKECIGLRKITVPFMDEIGTNVFEGCTALTDVEYYAPIVSEEMFKNCIVLQRINFNEPGYGYTLEAIHERAFEGCTT
ncbi:MAG: leucine-rich repeat protein, partial [Anaeroplasmataceae bacterium]|nr:leucine-rich repeat protein [Anaeroplasmataceae bacterium]